MKLKVYGLVYRITELSNQCVSRDCGCGQNSQSCILYINGFNLGGVRSLPLKFSHITPLYFSKHWLVSPENFETLPNLQCDITLIFFSLTIFLCCLGSSAFCSSASLSISSSSSAVLIAIYGHLNTLPNIAQYSYVCTNKILVLCNTPISAQIHSLVLCNTPISAQIHSLVLCNTPISAQIHSLVLCNTPISAQIHKPSIVQTPMSALIKMIAFWILVGRLLKDSHKCRK